MAMTPPPWRNNVAVVSGGTSGLGLHLAIALAEQGARLALIGRDPDRLENAKKHVLQAGAASADGFAMDLADETSWHGNDGNGSPFKAWITNHQVKLLVNAVGRSDRGLLESLTARDLVDHFRVNVLSSFHLTQACLPSLKQTGGTVIDIASLSGIIPGPGMGAYTLSKHALVGMHRQWRLELHASPVHFMLVCPGPIERDDGDHRYDALVAARGLDARQAGPGGGVRLRRLDPNTLARRILDAAARKQDELIVPSKARWLAALIPLWPGCADRILRKRFS